MKNNILYFTLVLIFITIATCSKRPDINIDIVQEWGLLIKLDGCLVGGQYCSDGNCGGEGCCLNWDDKWINFIKLPKETTVPFLISRIHNTNETETHACPFQNAIEGELAIYCMQHILKINWFDLKKEYKKYFKMAEHEKEFVPLQYNLQKIIKNKEKTKQMAELWKKYFNNVKK